MKNLLYIFFLLIPIMGFSQGTPQGISYQAVAYDSEGFEISNQDISVRLGILLGGVDAEASYTEVHSVTTDDFGLFSLVISQGETSDIFSSINWEEGAYLKVEIGANLDGEYNIMGVSSFNAVPYALYAPTDNRVDSLINAHEYMLTLISTPLQESIDNGHSFSELISCCNYELNQFMGLNYEGGTIIYIDETLEHGLIAADEDAINDAYYNNSSILGFEWGCYGFYDINLSYSNKEIGSGYNNTADIYENCVTNTGGISAAEAAFNYESGGYIDWYLPSIDELGVLMNILQISESHWSSTALSSEDVNQNTTENTHSWFAHTNGGAAQGTKYHSRAVRPIRSF